MNVNAITLTHCTTGEIELHADGTYPRRVLVLQVTHRHTGNVHEVEFDHKVDTATVASSIAGVISDMTGAVVSTHDRTRLVSCVNLLRGC